MTGSGLDSSLRSGKLEGAMFIAVLTQSAGARLQGLSSNLWVRIALGVIVLVLAVVIIRKVAKMNKIILAIVLALVLSIIGFNWIYQRNEPAWATPVVSKIATFFPTKDSMK